VHAAIKNPDPASESDSSPPMVEFWSAPHALVLSVEFGSGQTRLVTSFAKCICLLPPKRSCS
jgi:hypothetical protein